MKKRRQRRGLRKRPRNGLTIGGVRFAVTLKASPLRNSRRKSMSLPKISAIWLVTASGDFGVVSRLVEDD